MPKCGVILMRCVSKKTSQIAIIHSRLPPHHDRRSSGNPSLFLLFAMYPGFTATNSEKWFASWIGKRIIFFVNTSICFLTVQFSTDAIPSLLNLLTKCVLKIFIVEYCCFSFLLILSSKDLFGGMAYVRYWLRNSNASPLVMVDSRASPLSKNSNIWTVSHTAMMMKIFDRQTSCAFALLNIGQTDT
jgi:hypothetical protein